LQGIAFTRQQPLPVVYKGIHLDCGYRLDVVVEGRVIVELKTVDRIAPIREAQILTYLRLAGIHTGLILNFNVPALHQGIKRMVL
jgi:GxxExxY protein